ncbi:MAG: restriction endonuclease [Castellaniella sp.]
MAVPTYDQFIEPVLRFLATIEAADSVKARFETRWTVRKRETGIFMTTSGFTAHTVDFAKSVEGIVLIDGSRLVNLMMDYGVGVSSKAVRIPKIDTDYFDE